MHTCPRIQYDPWLISFKQFFVCQYIVALVLEHGSFKIKALIPFERAIDVEEKSKNLQFIIHQLQLQCKQFTSYIQKKRQGH